MENNKIHVTVSLFFKIKDADMFGGAGSIGYSESKIDLNTADLSGFKLQEYAKGQIEGFAELLKASEENIQIVSRQEYEDNTDEDRGRADMDRITKRIDDTHACYAICEKECPDGIYADNPACMCAASKMAMKRLLEYEDTGLTPEQIMELKERDTARAPEPAPLGDDGMVCRGCGKKALPWDRFCGE